MILGMLDLQMHATKLTKKKKKKGVLSLGAFGIFYGSREKV